MILNFLIMEQSDLNSCTSEPECLVQILSLHDSVMIGLAGGSTGMANANLSPAKGSNTPRSRESSESDGERYYEIFK